MRSRLLASLLLALAVAAPSTSRAQEPAAEAPAPAAPAPAAAPAAAPAPSAKAPVAAPVVKAPAPAPPVAKTAPAAPPAPVAAKEEKKDEKAGAASKKASTDAVLDTAAKDFYTRLLAKDIEGLNVLCRSPFFFEGKAAGSSDDVKRRWSQTLENKALEGQRLYDIQYFTPEEMVAKYGKAPDKLAGWNISKGNMLSVANLGGRASVVLWVKRSPKEWQAAGFHD